MRPALLLPVALSLGVTLAACNTRSLTTTPDEPGEVSAPRTGDQQLLGMYRLQIEADALSYTLSRTDRAATVQPPQAIYYDLEINRFLSFTDFQIIGLGLESNGDLRVRFRHAHPFPAPNFTLPATALNRADLSYSGRLLVLAAAGNQPYFGGSVSLNPRLVPDADGYVSTGTLLSTPGFAGATAPYTLLVDEALDNRVGLSNGADPRGNYDPALGGWQQSNAIPGWTGFDSLHGGQAATGSFVLNKDELGALSGELHLALLIKYCDPRGAGGRTNRLPSNPVDVTGFAYRMPFGALDVSHVALGGSITLADTAGSTAPIQLRVRDWDARALEAADGNLSDEPDVTLVPPQTSGVPEVAIDSGPLGTGIVNLTPSGTNSGRPGDELTFVGSLTNTAGLAAGSYFALARAIDPENTIDTSTWHMGLPPDSETPSPSLALPLITYQAIPLTVETVSAPPVIESVGPTGTVGFTGEQVTFIASATGGPTSWAWDFDGGANPNTPSDPQPTVTLGSAGTYNGSVIATNGLGPSAPFAFTFTVSSPPPPPSVLSVTPTGAVGESGEAIMFSASVSGEVSGYSWNFNGGASPNTPTIPSPTVTLGATGSYDGVLVVTGPGGDSAPFGFTFIVTESVLPPVVSAVSPTGTVGESGTLVQFSATASNGPTEWSWEFGGGAVPNTSTQATPTVTLAAAGTYTGSVVASNAGGDSTPFPFSFTVTAPVLPPVVSLVSPTGMVGESGTLVQFSATASNGPTGWSWTFGGGAVPNTSTQATPTVTLGAAGTYSGSVVASNAGGDSAPFGFTFIVEAALEPPVIISVSPTGAIGEVDASVQFSAVIDGEVDTYAWNFSEFGSPGTSGSPTPTITLTDAGSFNGSLTVTNGAGSSAPFSFAVNITEPAGAPTWTQIHTMIRFGDPDITSSNCIQCHAFGAGGLFMTSDPTVTYNNIVNQPASFSCGLDYIEPSQPSNSLIYRKISETNPPCGLRMPRNGQYWTADAIQMVSDWIAAGANP